MRAKLSGIQPTLSFEPPSFVDADMGPTLGYPCLPIVVGHMEQTEPVHTAPVVGRGTLLLSMLQNFPPEIILSIYKFLVLGIMASSSIPSIRYVIPDIWWTSTKQLLFLSDGVFSVTNPIATITNGDGVLLPRFQKEVRVFFHGFKYGYQDHSNIPFMDWDQETFDNIPPSTSFSLPGNLFVVRFKFSRSGYYFTIEPNRDVYKLHDLNHHDETFGCFDEV